MCWEIVRRQLWAQNAVHALAFHQHPVFIAPYQQFAFEPAESIAQLVEFFAPEIQLDAEKMTIAIDQWQFRKLAICL